MSMRRKSIITEFHSYKNDIEEHYLEIYFQNKKVMKTYGRDFFRKKMKYKNF